MNSPRAHLGYQGQFEQTDEIGWRDVTYKLNFNVFTLGYLSIFKNIFKQNGERPNDSISPKDLKSKISDDLAQK